MEKVAGIGGVFFRARDPDALVKWYEDHLGVAPAPRDLETPPWIADGGVTVFAPFPETTEYFPDGQQVMINFRVTNLATMIAQLEDAGVPIFNETEMDGVGKFAHCTDPEGNVVELWEPVQG